MFSGMSYRVTFSWTRMLHYKYLIEQDDERYFLFVKYSADWLKNTILKHSRSSRRLFKLNHFIIPWIAADLVDLEFYPKKIKSI